MELHYRLVNPSLSLRCFHFLEMQVNSYEHKVRVVDLLHHLFFFKLEDKMHLGKEDIDMLN